MNARTIGLRFVELVVQQDGAKALEELYAEDIVSVEIMGNPEDPPQVWKGIDAVGEKHASWQTVSSMHGVNVEGPFAGNGDDHFVVRFVMDSTFEGKRGQMREVGLFTVAKGKIVKEVYLGLAS